jgi:hypothetical protein
VKNPQKRRKKWCVGPEKVVRKPWFGGSVVVRPLSRAQVLWYLDELKVAGARIRQALRDDPTLWELLDTPLMLYVVALTCGGDSGRPLPSGGTLDERREQLFDNYVDEMLHRRAVVSRYDTRKTGEMQRRHKDPRLYLLYPHERTKHWLSWLAWQMDRHDPNVFYIERLQPDWLPRKQEYVYRSVAGRVAGLGVGLCIGLIYNGLAGALLGGLHGGLDGGMYFGPELDEIDCAESAQWSWSAVGRDLSAALVLALVFGLAGGLAGGLVLRLVGAGVAGMFFGLLLGLGFGLLCGRYVREDLLSFRDEENETTIVPNQGIRQLARESLVFGLVGGLLSGLVGGLVGGLVFQLGVALIGALAVCFRAGGDECVKHFALRRVLVRNGLAPWNYARFLDYAAERILLNKQGGGYSFLHRTLLEHFARRFDASEYSD